MLTANSPNRNALQLSLYGGIALILISMLFLGRGQESTSFFVQALTVLAAPIFFYMVGILVLRHLNAPLAGPGILATGAWLIAVGLIHLYDRRILLPAILQPYYWLVASLAGAILITLTGHLIRIWMLVVLVPLTQINAMWAIFWALGLPVEWMPPLCFILVLAWWEIRFRDQEWASVYRVSAALLTVFLLVFSVWLPAPTARTMTLTWGVGALLAAFLGLRYGWVKFGPLAIAMLACASAWGLPASWWPAAWLILAASTIIFIERLTASRDKKGKGVKAVEISEALAVLLCGASVLLAEFGPWFGVAMHPLGTAVVLLGAGFLMAWLGWRRNLRISSHIGLWLIASGWSSLYFFALPDSHTFGLWLTLLASLALLIERLLTTVREKRKEQQTILQTIAFWPLADLIIGLSAFVVLWTAFEINTASPWVLTVTISISIGIWIAAGLIYRLPVLLHVALWLAPLPYALLLILLAPSIWTLPLLGLAWQFLGIGFLALGFSAPRYRPAVLSPFFITGYALVAFGLTTAMANPVLTPVSLTLVVFVLVASSFAVAIDRHPAWSMFTMWLIPPEARPYAHKNFRSLFLILSAWLAAVWLHLLLGYTNMPLARQGLFLVLFSCVWFALGSLLTRFPDTVSWPLVGAGWLMWSIGLLEVFYSRSEAMVAVVIGLLISGEMVRRSKGTSQIYWIPVFVIQVLFTALQASWLLAMPARTVLLLVGVCVASAGMIAERSYAKAGRAAALTGAVIDLGLAVLYPEIAAFACLTALAVMAVLVYRRWLLLLPVYLAVFLLGSRSGIRLDWQTLLVLGVAQCIVGAELVIALRPRRFRTLFRAVVVEKDWATPVWTIGGICLIAAFLRMRTSTEVFTSAFILATLFAIYSIRLRWAHLPYLSLIFAGVGTFGLTFVLLDGPFAMIGERLLSLTLTLAVIPVAIYGLCRYLIGQPTVLRQLRWGVWWIRPLLKITYVMSNVSLFMMLFLGSVYKVSPIFKIANGLVLALFAAQLYQTRHQIFWLWGAVALTWYSWSIALTALQLTQPMWQTIPLGITLFALARVTRQPILEYAATLLLLAGNALGLDRMHLLSSASIPLVIHLVGLVAYGYLGNRRVPFAAGSILMLGGLIFVIFKINVWLVPLAGGIMLIGGALFVETQHQIAERWVSGWVARWQQWQ